MESFLGRIRKPFVDIQHDQSEAITVEHIRIYVFGFFIANCLCIPIFLGEITYFHRKNILAFLRRGILATEKAMRRIVENGMLFLINLREFPRRGMQSVMQRIENGLLRNRIWCWRFYFRDIPRIQAMFRRIKDGMHHCIGCKFLAVRRILRLMANWRTKIKSYKPFCKCK